MNRLSAVNSQSAEVVKSVAYAAALGTIGYETRARWLLQAINPAATVKTAWAFASRRSGAFDTNVEWFTNAGYSVSACGEQDVEAWAENWTRQVCEPTTRTSVRILVDISCMSRQRLAALIGALIRTASNQPVVVDFMYSLAKWTPPSEVEEPIVSAGAVTPFFSGWSSDPDLPVSAIIGMGYEPGKAVGAYEYLEAMELWAFVPQSEDARYVRDVNRANRTLLARVPFDRQMSYPVNNPFQTFIVLEALVASARQRTRPVLIPFGPKVFALSCLLVASHFREVPVWRISSGQDGVVGDRIPDGSIVGVQAVFSPPVPRATDQA